MRQGSRFSPFFLLCAGWLLAGLTVVPVGPATGQTRVLFVGNSFTHGNYAPVLNYNSAAVTDENFGQAPGSPRHQANPSTPGPWGGVPGIFKKFTEQAGLNYAVHIGAISAATLEYHHANALALVQQQPWDQVVLQELSTLPLPVARTGRPTAFFEYANQLELDVRTGNPAARIYLFQTWARADMTYPAGQPYSGLPIDTMTQDLHKAVYQLAARNPRLSVAPVGDAWLRAIRAGIAMRNPYAPTAGQLNLWGADCYHSSKWGAYLAACVLFGQLTGQDPRTLGPAEQAAAALDIAPLAAAALQRLAFEQVMAPNGPLPVVLTAFAARREATGVAVRWATATEERNAAFEVQRSSDAVHFTAVGTVPGRGTATQASSYSFFDAMAPHGLLYYRLRQVDTNGAATLSPVVAVPGSTAPELAVFPNPARNYFVVTAPAATRYRLHNQLGQQVGQGVVGSGAVTVPLAGLPVGIYHLTLETAGSRAVRRLVRQ